MRPPFLQYLYLQKPVTTVLIVCALSVLPWIGLGDFATKGEPREAAVAVSMIESGNWILPEVYADEFAYKPPLAHWLMAAFSLPRGYVSEFTARLPSALSYIVLMGMTLFFFGRRMKLQEAFIGVLLLFTCVEIHRAGTTARVDMLLTALIVSGLYALYRWEDSRELKGLPFAIPFLLGSAVLTKGPVGIVLPLFVFGVYLLLLGRYRKLIVFKALLYAGVSSLFLPLIWYVSAWRQGGDAFLDVALAENFGRFFHIDQWKAHYELGHENGLWYNFATLLAGFAPWTLLFVFSLFGMPLRKPSRPIGAIPKALWQQFRSMEKLKQFSLVALVCILFFYSIPHSKRSVYLMPAYPFIALFLAQYTLYITQYRAKAIRLFTVFLAAAVSVALAVSGLTMAGVTDPVAWASRFTDRTSTLLAVEAATRMFSSPDGLTMAILAVVSAALITVFYQMFRKIHMKMLYAAIFLVFATQLLIDGVAMRGVRNGTSSRPFAERIRKEYPVDTENMYVMNNLKEYSNLYGLNFYLKNHFHNFEAEQPEAGYFFAAERDMEQVAGRYGDTYTFIPLASSEKEVGEVRQKIRFYRFARHQDR
ncbi:MAG: glycosyltransferase family 39 protein [Tannerellaceae bacterium]|jgi:4-amino-4-deoxy-L-arabinose transferase-like glycosyltransferase|nr:glycosyltransferase family 39 protein [Tannerellaceae bacterium]